MMEAVKLHLEMVRMTECVVSEEVAENVFLKVRIRICDAEGKIYVDKSKPDTGER